MILTLILLLFQLAVSTIITDDVLFPIGVRKNQDFVVFGKFAVISGNGFIDIVKFNGTWSYSQRLIPHVNLTSVTDFGNSIRLSNDVLLVSAICNRGAVIHTFNNTQDMWIFEQLVYISAENNLVTFPSNNKDILSLKSNREFVVFTLDAGFLTAAFIKVYTKDLYSGIWELRTIFSPNVKFSSQNSYGMICWSDSYLFISYYQGIDKIEVYTFDEIYQQSLMRIYVNNSVSVTGRRYMDCKQNKLAISNPNYNNINFTPNITTGIVRMLIPQQNNTEPIYTIELQDSLQINRNCFGSAISMDNNKIVIGAVVNNTLNQRRSVYVYSYNDTGAMLLEYFSNGQTIIFSSNRLIVGINNDIVITNMNFRTGVVSNNVSLITPDNHTLYPTFAPTKTPTTKTPSRAPSTSPTTKNPTRAPVTLAPSSEPTYQLTMQPTTKKPTFSPTTRFKAPQNHFNIWFVFFIVLLIVTVLEVSIYKAFRYRKNRSGYTKIVSKIVPS